MVRADDFSNSRAVPNLRKAISSKDLRTKLSISEVFGELDPDELKNYLVSTCQAAVISLDGSSKLYISDLT